MPGADLSELPFSSREKPAPLDLDLPALDVFLRIRQAFAFIQ